MEINDITAQQVVETKNEVALQTVQKDTELKTWLVDYVGNQHDDKDDEVTIEMIVKTMAEEFPEFLLVVAEENWIRGYHQAFVDIETGEMLMNKGKEKTNEEQNS